MNARVAHEKQKEGCRAWHRKMTREHRCHWCGEPSAPGYLYACLEHAPFYRENSRLWQQRRRKRRLAVGLCTVCGEEPARLGRSSCKSCARLNAKKARDKRERRAIQKYDEVVDLGLIGVTEAAEAMGVHTSAIHDLIKRGVLSVQNRIRNRLYLSIEDIKQYQQTREEARERVRGITCICLRCNYRWSPRKPLKRWHCARCTDSHVEIEERKYVLGN